ncbi:hypothetical protein P4132_21055 [Pseudomonas aeruginosa]|nr:hypothetical protein [Pseudomonas aeruginosa]
MQAYEQPRAPATGCSLDGFLSRRLPRARRSTPWSSWPTCFANPRPPPRASSQDKIACDLPRFAADPRSPCSHAPTPRRPGAYEEKSSTHRQYYEVPGNRRDRAEEAQPW